MDRWSRDGHCVYTNRQCMSVLSEEEAVGMCVYTGAFLKICSLALCTAQTHGPRFITLLNCHKNVRNLVVKIIVSAVTVTLVPGKPRINSFF